VSAPRSLLSQRERRFGACRLPRGRGRRQERRCAEGAWRRDKRNGVERRHSEQQRCQRACQCGGADDPKRHADRHDTDRIAEHQPHHIRTGCAERHADAQLAAALLDREGEEARDADRGNDHG
jgi:hypothetical protein